MKVRYVYSACIEITTHDVRILTDPWFTPGAYHGSWHQFPRLADPLETLREPDLIYVSHIHPDHYDPIFLRELFAKWGPKPVLIPDFKRNYLHLKASRDGINVTPTSEAAFGGTRLHIVPNVTESEADIDSALVVNAEGQTVLNLNDCLWNDAHIAALHGIVRRYGDEIDLCALGYTGAGPYPQTYFDPVSEEEELLKEAHRKKLRFFDRYRRYQEAFPAKRYLPFAGKYLLGGHLAPLNPYRGVADAVEVLTFDDRAIVLADGGTGEIDLATGEVTATRTEPYSDDAIAARVAEVARFPLDYEREIAVPYDKIDFRRLLAAAASRAQHRSEVKDDYWFVLHVEHAGEVVESFSFNVRKGALDFGALEPGCELPVPRSEYFVDYRHLYGCLTAVYHWNNSEVGSFVRVRRVPNTFNRAAQAALNFLVCV